MSFYFQGDTADEVYTEAFSQIQTNGLETQSRNGNTSELLHSVLSLKNSRQRLITARKPTVSIAYAFAELIQLMAGNDEARVINPWNPALPKYQGEYNRYPGSYGYRLRYSFGFNQLERTYDALKYKPISRQGVVQIWDPATDLPHRHGEPNNMDIPCSICSLLKIRDNKLYWTQVIRSNDIFRGFPYDLLLFTTLQEIFSGWLQIDVGEYLHVSDSLHMYESEKCSLQNKIETGENNDDLRLNKKESDEVFEELFVKMNELSSSSNIDRLVRDITLQCSVPMAYHNMLMVLCIYSIFKNGTDKSLIHHCSEECSNKLYIELMNRWMCEREGKSI